jgi:dihydropyrimidinase
VGSDADLVIWDPNAKSNVSVESQIQNCDSNIYEGMAISGKAEYVLRNGEIL